MGLPIQWFLFVLKYRLTGWVLKIQKISVLSLTASMCAEILIRSLHHVFLVNEELCVAL